MLYSLYSWHFYSFHINFRVSLIFLCFFRFFLEKLFWIVKHAKKIVFSRFLVPWKLRYTKQPLSRGRDTMSGLEKGSRVLFSIVIHLFAVFYGILWNFVVLLSVLFNICSTSSWNFFDVRKPWESHGFSVQ